tara:strand:+ start:195156 stop:195599 length:444 start_codon:yes stop_codon:yes gene_type:complete
VINEVQKMSTLPTPQELLNISYTKYEKLKLAANESITAYDYAMKVIAEKSEDENAILNTCDYFEAKYIEMKCINLSDQKEIIKLLHSRLQTAYDELSYKNVPKKLDTYAFNLAMGGENRKLITSVIRLFDGQRIVQQYIEDMTEDDG